MIPDRELERYLQDASYALVDFLLQYYPSIAEEFISMLEEDFMEWIECNVMEDDKLWKTLS